MHVPPTSLISTLSLHDALPICGLVLVDDALGGGLVELAGGDLQGLAGGIGVPGGDGRADLADVGLELRSEEHTSELQSRGQLVCRLLHEKKKKQKPLALHIHTC